MKKGIVITLIVVVVAGIGLFFLYNQGGAEAFGIKPSPSTEVAGAAIKATAIPPVIATNEIIASGHLVPANYADLSFLTSGTLLELLVEEGQAVEKGQVIARLSEEAEVNYEIAQAQLEVLNAQKNLDDLYANAPLIAAQARYDINLVEKELEKAIKRRSAMEYAKGTQKDINTAFRKYQDAESDAKEVESWGTSNDKEMREVYEMAQREKNAAWANYTFLITPYTAKEKAEQDAIVNLNQQKLDDLKTKASIYSEGPDPQEVSIAQAQLNLAKNRLAIAEAKKERLVLSAPFSGIVVSLSVRNGQIVSAGQAILTLADTSRWHIETEDLTEVNVTRIHEGAEAVVSFDALPGETFKGMVIAIKDLGEIKKGDITYTAVIEIENTDERLRWNMTSPVTILTD